MSKESDPIQEVLNQINKKGKEKVLVVRKREKKNEKKNRHAKKFQYKILSQKKKREKKQTRKEISVQKVFRYTVVMPIVIFQCKICSE
jgi:hypothetical protein